MTVELPIESETEDRVTTTKFGPGTVTTRNQMPNKLARAASKSISSIPGMKENCAQLFPGGSRIGVIIQRKYKRAQNMVSESAMLPAGTPRLLL